MELDSEHVISSLREFDVNRTGLISREEFVRTFKGAVSETLSGVAVEVLLRDICAQNDAAINYEACIARLNEGRVVQLAVLDEVKRLSGVETGRREIDQISVQELEEIRALRTPPLPVQRALEATCLILGAKQSKQPPRRVLTWNRVQRIIGAPDFIQSVQDFNLAALASAPELVAYIGTNYFGASSLDPHREQHNQIPHESYSPRLSAGASKLPTPRKTPTLSGLSRCSTISLTPRSARGSSPSGSTCSTPREPLTEERVKRASKAAAALFRWCSSMVVSARALAQADPPLQNGGSEGILDAAVIADTMGPPAPREALEEPTSVTWLMLWTMKRIVFHAWRNCCAQRRARLADLEAMYGARLPQFEAQLDFHEGFRKVEQQLAYNASSEAGREKTSGPGYAVYEPFDCQRLREERATNEQGADLSQKLNSLSDAARLCRGLEMQLATCEDASETTRLRLFSVRDWFEERLLFCDCILSDQIKTADILCRLVVGRHDKHLRHFFLARAAAAATWDAMATQKSLRQFFNITSFIHLSAWRISGGNAAARGRRIMIIAAASRAHFHSMLLFLELQHQKDQVILKHAGLAAHLETRFQVVQPSRQWDDA